LICIANTLRIGFSNLSIIGLPNNLLPVGCVHRFSLPAGDLVFV
jgi:hypothetical protein